MSDTSFTTVFTASSFEEAYIVAGFLESEGIKTRVPGAGYVDEFGMATKLAGFAEVAVLAGDLEAAQDIVAAWKERGDSGKDAEEPDAPQE
jgi:hypothetical protein